ncbi:DUF4123 domain-containing protein [Paracoccus aminophilus]|uniref:DUF4123 domain-containing protein n=1 Tax=Paracoccus aminophilus TaxID=34003 RepID=UPI0011DD9C3C|nr:DUF4123 domain-containing protein [Paracoccus aminophilus]
MVRWFDDEVETIWLKNLTPSREGEIPDALAEHIFGGPQRTYAIFDIAMLREGLALIEAEPGYHGSLLEGDAARGLADVMPSLVELSPDARLTRKLFREVPGYDAALGTLHLWPANPALFIRSTFDPATLRNHLRRFLKPMDFKGQRRYLRLWNPSVAYDYLHNSSEVTPFLRLYLGLPGDNMILIARNGSAAVIARAVSPPRRDDRPILSQADLHALTFRVKRDFHEKLVNRVISRAQSRGYAFELARVGHVAGLVMAVMEDHEPGDVPKMKDHERLTLVLLMMHDDAAPVVLSGPVIRNKLLPWSTRVDVVAKSYLTGLRQIYGLEVV